MADVYAQGPSAGLSKNDGGSLRIQQAPLDPVIIFDADGRRLITLPGGWPLEVMDEFSRFLLQDQRDPTPPFTLQEVTGQGRVVGNRVETVIRIVITTSDERVVRVPIGLNEGVLAFPIENRKKNPDENSEQVVVDQSLPYRYSGPGSFELIVDPRDGQFIASIRPKARPVTQSILPTNTDSALFSTKLEDSENSENKDDSNEESGTESLATETLSAETSPTETPAPIVKTQRHILTLSLWFPLTRIGEEEQRLSISFPQAVSSRMNLTVPIKDAAATIAPGSLLDSEELHDQEATQFTILGLKPNFEISWRKRKAEPVEERPVLYVKEALIDVQLENKTTLYDATLPIRSPLGGFDRLRIRLPDGAVLDRENTEKFASADGYSFRELSREEHGTETPPGQSDEDTTDSPENQPASIVEIQFPDKKTEVTVRLRAIRQNMEEKPETWHDMEGFELIGAERQSGFLSVRIPPDMRSNWKPVRSVRRVDLTAAMLQDGVDARFEFFSQPFLLQSQIVLPETRINVKPEYLIDVKKGSLSLAARFSYVIHGSKTEKLEIRLPGWQWNNEIEPIGTVDIEGVNQDETGLLTIPLRVPSDGVVDITLRANRLIPFDEEGKKRLVVRLPQPIATWSEPASVVIVPADNVEIIPIDSSVQATTSYSESVESAVRETSIAALESASTSANNIAQDNAPKNVSPTRTVGLTRRARRTLLLRLDIPVRQQDPLIYQTESDDAVFVADVVYHRQKVTASVRTDLRLLVSEEQVLQVISYDVAYEPVDGLFLAVPRNLQDEGRLRVAIGGRTFELRDVISSSEETVPDQWVRKRISLTEAMIGRFQLSIRYTIPQVAVKHDQTTTLSLPLIYPVDTNIASNDLNMIVPPGVRVDLNENVPQSWRLVEAGSSILSGNLRNSSNSVFHSSQAQSRISLLVRLADRDVLGTTVVDRVWLQTWLTGSVRMDRCVFQITSDQESITLRLPIESTKGSVSVNMDRVPIPVILSPQQELTIPLNAEQKTRPFVLELWYRMPFDSMHTSVRMELPHFIDTETLVRSQYWQIILPQNRHIIGIPDGWTPEYQWTWNRLFWGRVPALTMERAGIQGDPAYDTPISTEANQYLFSSLHPQPETKMYIIDRSLIVLFSSGSALLVGLILIYFPKTRYAGSLFALGVAFLAMFLYRPAPVLLALQASAFGVVLALIASYIYRIVYREEKWVVPAAGAWHDSTQPSEVYSVIMDDETDQEKESEN